jgi:hypothetical protein
MTLAFRPAAGFRHQATCPKLETAADSTEPLCACEEQFLPVHVKAFRLYRVQAGLTVEDAAELLDVSADQLHGFETGWADLPPETIAATIRELERRRLHG